MIKNPKLPVIGKACFLLITSVLSLSAQAREFANETDEVLYYFGTQIGIQIQATGISDPDQIQMIHPFLQLLTSPSMVANILATFWFYLCLILTTLFFRFMLGHLRSIMI